MCLYWSSTDILLIVSYPKIMLNENAADCTRRAESPLKNMWNFSSAHSSTAALANESSRWTCNLARIMSSGFVIIVVVNPPDAPATHCINKCDVFEGKTFMSSSVEREKKINKWLSRLKNYLNYLDTSDRMPTKVPNSGHMLASLPCTLCSSLRSRPFGIFPLLFA